MSNILYICNRKKCNPCHFPQCRYTKDIEFAQNFCKGDGDFYIEVMPGRTNNKRNQKGMEAEASGRSAE